MRDFGHQGCRFCTQAREHQAGDSLWAVEHFVEEGYRWAKRGESRPAAQDRAYAIRREREDGERTADAFLAGYYGMKAGLV